jgi:hypothetical protein
VVHTQVVYPRQIVIPPAPVTNAREIVLPRANTSPRKRKRNKEKPDDSDAPDTRPHKRQQLPVHIQLARVRDGPKACRPTANKPQRRRSPLATTAPITAIPPESTAPYREKSVPRESPRSCELPAVVPGSESQELRDMVPTPLEVFIAQRANKFKFKPCFAPTIVMRRRCSGTLLRWDA